MNNFLKPLYRTSALSLTEYLYSEKMWKNYAENSTGVAFGFEMRNNNLFSKIEYIESLADFFTINELVDSIYLGRDIKINFNMKRKVGYVKKIQFSYEKKWRDTVIFEKYIKKQVSL